MNESPVILFDGICNLCCWWVRFLLKQDKKEKFRYASIQSVSGERLFKSAGLDNNTLKTIVYMKGNDVFIESAAVLEILKELGGLWVITGIFKQIPTSIRDNCYLFISKYRYKIFGKRRSCYIPTPENNKRFLT